MSVETEPQSGSKIRKINLATPKAREWISRLPEENIRRLFLLVQYQSFKTWADFSDAVRSLKESIKAGNHVTGNYWYPPERRQVLGRLHQIKSEEFIDYWGYVEAETGIDIFLVSATADIESLHTENNIFAPMQGASVKLFQANINDPSLTIPLPKLLEKELARRTYTEDSSTQAPPLF